MIGLNPFFKTKGGHPISIMFQYGVNEEFNTFGIGLSLGLVKARAKN